MNLKWFYCTLAIFGNVVKGTFLFYLNAKNKLRNSSVVVSYKYLTVYTFDWLTASVVRILEQPKNDFLNIFFLIFLHMGIVYKMYNMQPTVKNVMSFE